MAVIMFTHLADTFIQRHLQSRQSALYPKSESALKAKIDKVGRTESSRRYRAMGKI